MEVATTLTMMFGIQVAQLVVTCVGFALVAAKMDARRVGEVPKPSFSEKIGRALSPRPESFKKRQPRAITEEMAYEKEREEREKFMGV